MSTGATHSGGTLWGGRFADAPSDALFALSRSVQFDWRLAPYDLRSSLAHLAILESSGLLPAETVSKLRDALKELQTEVITGKFSPIAINLWEGDGTLSWKLIITMFDVVVVW